MLPPEKSHPQANHPGSKGEPRFIKTAKNEELKKRKVQRPELADPSRKWDWLRHRRGTVPIRTVLAGAGPHFHDAWVGGTPMTNC